MNSIRHIVPVLLITSFPIYAPADTIYWADWTSRIIGQTTGSAQGTISVPSNPVGVTYTGEVTSETRTDNSYPSWGPAASFTGGDVGNAPPPGDIVTQYGGPGTGVNTITFSQAIHNPVMAIWSLGNPGTVTQYVFPSNELVNIQGGGPNNEYGGSSIYLVTGANAITGNEGNGVIEFIGDYNSISFTNPINEGYYGFTLGIVGIAVPEPATPTLFATAVVALCTLRRRGTRA